MLWLWVTLVLVLTASLTFVGMLAYYFIQVKRLYLGYIVRIFVEKPLFIIPRGEPLADAEDVRVPTSEGLVLRGCYLRTPKARRLGVILFGLEFGSNRWACVPYTRALREAGFDIFALEPRSQGESSRQPDYEPLQWVTDYEVQDAKSALAYLKARPDADRRGVGFFGISKGGSAGIIAAARDPFVRCFVTDGIFATLTTMVPFMRKWVPLYSNRYMIQKLLPNWTYGHVANMCLKQIRRERGIKFPHLEREIPYLAPRPFLMIHGGGDTYIKPEMAKSLFDLAGEPREFWIVQGAKHNQAMHVANGEYQQRVLAFFQTHLADPSAAPKTEPQDTANPPSELRELAQTK